MIENTSEEFPNSTHRRTELNVCVCVYIYTLLYVYVYIYMPSAKIVEFRLMSNIHIPLYSLQGCIF
jgi:hypothetical protein